MKLTNKQLRQIIKEELNSVLNEASGYYVVQFTPDGATVNDQNGEIMTVMKGQYPYYAQIQAAARGDAEGMRGLKRQIAEKTGNENIADSDIKFNTMNEAEKSVKDLITMTSYKNNGKSPPKSFYYNNGLFAYTEDGVNVKSLDPDDNGGYAAVEKIFYDNGYRNNSVTVRGYQ